MPFKFIMPRCCNALSQRIYSTLFYYFNLAFRRSSSYTWKRYTVLFRILKCWQRNKTKAYSHTHQNNKSSNSNNKCAFTCCVRYLCAWVWWFYFVGSTQYLFYYGRSKSMRVYQLARKFISLPKMLFTHRHTRTHFTCLLTVIIAIFV